MNGVLCVCFTYIHIHTCIQVITVVLYAPSARLDISDIMRAAIFFSYLARIAAAALFLAGVSSEAVARRVERHIAGVHGRLFTVESAAVFSPHLGGVCNFYLRCILYLCPGPRAIKRHKTVIHKICSLM